MNKWLLAMLVLLSGSASKDYFRTAIGTMPCLVEPDAGCGSASLLLDEKDGYALGFVEFNDKRLTINHHAVNWWDFRQSGK